MAQATSPSRSSQTLTEPGSKRTDMKLKTSNPSLIDHVFSHSLLTQEVVDHHYHGSGTEDDPYIVEFIPNDPRNPQTWTGRRRWGIAVMVSLATLAVSFVSSAYSGAVVQIIDEFHCTDEVVTLGISLFVLGFAVGPLLWAPMSELYGRQVLFIGTYGMLTLWNAAATGAHNIETLIIFRFLAGVFGSSPLTNAGGVIADIFAAKERGIALAVFAAAPFLGPALGPVVGGFVGETIGWRWLEGIMAIFSGILWIMGTLLIPETYPPVLLRKRAAALAKYHGKVYKTKQQASGNAPTPKKAFKTALSRPWVLLFREPIVLLLSIYMAIIYGTLYMMFGAFPIVYQQQRGWSEGIGGLAFLGVMVGMMFAVGYTFWDNSRYVKTEQRWKDKGERGAPPESRLPPALIASVAIPVGLFWFAWTNGVNIHWIVSIIAGAPFGFGMVLVFLAIMNYLIDSYTIYAASVLAGNSVLRSMFGFAFPLFTTQMYSNLGVHWASSVPAFLALMCVPFPFLFYKYGASIRRKCKYARQAEEIMAEMQRSAEETAKESDDDSDDKEKADEGAEMKGVQEGMRPQGETNFHEEKDLERGVTTPPRRRSQELERGVADKASEKEPASQYENNLVAGPSSPEITHPVHHSTRIGEILDPHLSS